MSLLSSMSVPGTRTEITVLLLQRVHMGWLNMQASRVYEEYELWEIMILIEVNQESLFLFPFELVTPLLKMFQQLGRGECGSVSYYSAELCSSSEFL